MTFIPHIPEPGIPRDCSGCCSGCRGPETRLPTKPRQLPGQSGVSQGAFLSRKRRTVVVVRTRCNVSYSPIRLNLGTWARLRAAAVFSSRRQLTARSTLCAWCAEPQPAISPGRFTSSPGPGGSRIRRERRGAWLLPVAADGMAPQLVGSWCDNPAAGGSPAPAGCLAPGRFDHR